MAEQRPIPRDYDFAIVARSSSAIVGFFGPLARSFTGPLARSFFVGVSRVRSMLRRLVEFKNEVNKRRELPAKSVNRVGGQRSAAKCTAGVLFLSRGRRKCIV